MDNVIQKVSEEKYENVVQFNVVNTTNQSQYVNLLNTATLTPVTTSPTISYPANTSLGTFVAPFVNPITAFNTSNGDIYIGASGSNLLYVYDSNYNFITTITLGFPFVNDCRDLVYNSVDNTMYVIPVTQPDIVIVDCASYTIYTTISTPISNWISATYCTQENSVYVTTNIGFVLLIDSFLSVSTIAVSPQPYFIVYDDLQNRVYFGDNLTNTMEYIDCATNTYVNINVSFPLLITMPTFGVAYCPLNGSIYVRVNDSTLVIVFDTNTDTFLPTLSFSVSSDTSTLAFDSNQNLMYLSYKNSSIIYFNPLNNAELGALTTSNTFIVLQFNPYNNQLSTSSTSTDVFELFTTTDLYSQSYYITGSSNYNAFVYNLNNEPIYVELIRLLVGNLNQLTNQLQLTKIDSNGNQVFFPEFPINKIDVDQNNNIADIMLNGLVFDGRTYVNQYQLNPYETVSFEIYYKQLDLTSASYSFPIMFKNKVSLKKYIEDNYDDFIEY